MGSVFDGFVKNKDYLICVDSDGCAMDTMNVKHIKCFGPCMVKEWNLSEWEDEILKRWNEINLFTMTRGVNRFQGLLIALKEIDERYTHIDGLLDLEKWVEHTDIVLAQNAGSKSYCIGELLKKGYMPEHVLMTGDAPEDYNAAKENGVYFYPILVRSEEESWNEFKGVAVSNLVEGNYGGAYQLKKIDDFLDNLKQ